MKHIYLFVLFLFTLAAHAQNRTVYVVKNDSLAKPSPKTDGDSFFDNLNPFAQFAGSIPLRYNPEYGNTNTSNGDAATYFLPDGLSMHGGMGFHIGQTLAFTANSGFDWHIETGLFSVPVYGSAILNIRYSDEESILLQYGYGRAFAIGHGNLSGGYQKFRVGYVIDILGIFAEINNYGYAWKDAPTMSSINFGVQLFVFE
ncbi:MAG: hypothetical protein V4581_08405 [Bacteroidota bacterium]